MAMILFAIAFITSAFAQEAKATTAKEQAEVAMLQAQEAYYNAEMLRIQAITARLQSGNPRAADLTPSSCGLSQESVAKMGRFRQRFYAQLFAPCALAQARYAETVKAGENMELALLLGHDPVRVSALRPVGYGPYGLGPYAGYALVQEDRDSFRALVMNSRAPVVTNVQQQSAPAANVNITVRTATPEASPRPIVVAPVPATDSDTEAIERAESAAENR